MQLVSGPKRVYVDGVSFDGAAHSGTTIPHAVLAAGGTLRFEISDVPREEVVPDSGHPASQTPNV